MWGERESVIHSIYWPWNFIILPNNLISSIIRVFTGYSMASLNGNCKNITCFFYENISDSDIWIELIVLTSIVFFFRELQHGMIKPANFSHWEDVDFNSRESPNPEQKWKNAGDWKSQLDFSLHLFVHKWFYFEESNNTFSVMNKGYWNIIHRISYIVKIKLKLLTLNSPLHQRIERFFSFSLRCKNVDMGIREKFA